MENNTKIILLAVFILLIAILSISLNGKISGKMIVFGDYEGKPVEVGGCRDSDGDSWSISGQCTDKTMTQSDSCIGNKVIEWYCGKSGNMISGNAPIIVWDFGQPSSKPQPEYKCYSKTYDCNKVRDWSGSYRCANGKCIR